MTNNYHESVMVEEVIDSLHMNTGPSGPEKDCKYVDATAGNGGHMLSILEKGGHVLGIEMDPKMLAISRERLKGKKNFKLVHGNFINVDRIVKENDWLPISGILFDLGVSNIHLKDLERGFSFENPNANLDMRLDPETQNVKGSDLLNVLREDQLEDLFQVTLDPGPAKWITGRVLHSRAIKPIENVGDLLEICTGLKTGKSGLNEATLPFLALRIAVNSELDNLREALPKAFELLEPGGRIAVISFHSKEDGIVKNFFKEKSQIGEAKSITLSPLRAQAREVEGNRSARSAKMRVLQKI